MAIYRGAGGAGDATGDSASEALLVRELAAEVTADAAAAEAARAAAVAAQTAAELAETNAETAETNAETAEANAETAEANAETAQAAAEAAQAAAETAQTAAELAETNAETAETNAETAATAAASSASAASTSASNASTSATAAASSASSASTSATNAANSATAAASSASSASTSATNAANSATAAQTAETNAELAETNAETAQAAAELAETNAETAASNAATSETNAAASASAAATSATNAANSASSASTSATNAASSATSAASSATAAAASYDSFDDRYLGAKATAPTLDNDGAALINGALYFDTALNVMRAYSTTGGWQSITNALASEPVRHSVRPSLLLDFANTKTLDPRITFTRASTGTFYDGKTVAKAEENLVQYSQEFDNAYWTKAGITVTANATTAPDGTSTAENIITTDEALSVHRIRRTNAIPLAANTATWSVFVKANGYTKVALREGVTSGSTAAFDLSGSGSLIADNQVGAVAVSNSTITSLSNGWFRISTTFTGTTSVGFDFVILNPSYTSGIVTTGWTADGVSGVFLWGAQLEQRSSLTAYTATTTAPITNYIPALQTAASGVARFEHNPVTGESLGLEIEEQRTNLLTYSDDFSNAVWTKTESTIESNIIIAPAGTLTGDKLVEGSSNDQHSVRQGLTAAADTLMVNTAYVKAGERLFVTLSLDRGASNFISVKFSLADGSIVETKRLGGNFSTTYSGFAVNAGNGWYRLGIIGTSVGTTGTPGFKIATATENGVIADDKAGAESYQGDGYSGVYVYGAQREHAGFATSYIPTVASQVTRSADSASMTGTNFSSWYRADEGTLYAEAVKNGFPASGAQVLVMASNGSSLTERVQLGVDGSASARGGEIIVRSSGTTTANIISSSSLVVGQSYKLSLTYKTNDVAFYRDSTSLGTDSSVVVPNGNTQFNIGQFPTSAGYWNGTIKKISFYPLRLTNAELQGLTTV
jgi:hypothetical protein